MVISVFICDPDLLIREGVKEMLAPFGEFHVSGEAENMADTLQALKKIPPDICIVEVVIGRNASLQFLRQVKEVAGNTQVLVMGYRHEREFAIRAHRAGAAGYLAKDCTVEQLVSALKTVAGHRRYISETMREMFVESIAIIRNKRMHDSLSDTDYEILCLLAQSVPAPRIAAHCKLTTNFVRKRKSRIMEHLALRNEAEIVEYAMQRNLIDLPY